MVNGKAKECRNYVDSKQENRIVCDLGKFYSNLREPENDSVQYKIAHHEFATLAGLEVPREADSQYWISDQVTGFLENQTVRRLAIRPNIPGKALLGTFKMRNPVWPAAAVSADGRRLAYSSRDGFVIVDLLTGRELRVDGAVSDGIFTAR